MENRRIILKDDKIFIPFKRAGVHTFERVIGWDCNELKITGFSPRTGFIHVDLRPLISARIVYQEKRSKAQKISSKRLRAGKRILEKYSHRERNKCRDIERKIAVQLIRVFPKVKHGFENLDKENMISRKQKNKNLRKRIARVSWRKIVKEIKERALVEEVDPAYTSKTCSRCGFEVEDLNGKVFFCPKCGISIDRQKNAAVNIYIKMGGFPHSEDWWDEVVKPLIRQEMWVGVALTGAEPMIWSPMKRRSDGGEAQKV